MSRQPIKRETYLYYFLLAKAVTFIASYFSLWKLALSANFEEVVE